jgi:surface carbohydrate biosynthesis protein
MPRRRIALIVDHPQRDLAGLVLTAVGLCQRGAVCHLVSLNLQDKEVWALVPDLVLLNFFRPSNESFVRRLRSAGIGYGLLDTEGGVWADVGAYEENLWRDDALMKGAACVCLWGPRVADHLLRHQRFASDQVTVTGCPRFDFYSSTWKSVLSDGTAGAEGSGRQQVLINTQYGLSNSRFVSRDTNAAELEKVYGWSRSRVERYLDAETEAIEAIVGLAGRLAGDFPDVAILLRPHPFESPEIYRRKLGTFSNVAIDGDGPVQPRIFSAAAVIQRSCTTAIEAALAGVPGLSPRWIPAPSENPMAEAVSEPCESYAELESRLRSILDGTYQRSAKLCSQIESVVHDWFHRSDGRAHERVAEAVARSWGGSRIVDERLCKRYLYGLGVGPASLPVKLGKWARFAIGLSPDWSFRRRRRVPFRQKRAKDFGVGEVALMAQRIEVAWRETGRDLRPVSVGAAAERGDYANGFMGQSVTLTCET